jgi:hypothetical protein
MEIKKMRTYLLTPTEKQLMEEYLEGKDVADITDSSKKQHLIMLKRRVVDRDFTDCEIIEQLKILSSFKLKVFMENQRKVENNGEQ